MARVLGAEGVEIPVASPARGALRALALPALAVAVIAALGMTTLRSAIVDLRYQLAERVHEERSLEEQRRALTAQVQRLRDPKRLTRIARERGFVRPSQVIDLGPAPVGTERP